MSLTIVRRLTNIAQTGHTQPEPWQMSPTEKEDIGQPMLNAQQTFDRTQIFGDDQYDVGDIYNEEQIARLRLDWGIDM